MNKLKRAFQMLAGNIPQRDICEQLRMGRGVLDKYKKLPRRSFLNLREDRFWNR